MQSFEEKLQADYLMTEIIERIMKMRGDSDLKKFLKRYKRI